MPISNKFIKYSQWLVVVGSLLALIVSIIIIKNKYNSNYLVINNNKINIDIANNDTKIISGLSNIKNIKNNYGMLFDFPNYGEPTFWNKDMLFAIDVVWLKDNLVVGIDSLPAVANGLKSITPPQIVNQVLELKAGGVIKYNIKVNDAIEVFQNE